MARQPDDKTRKIQKHDSALSRELACFWIDQHHRIELERAVCGAGGAHITSRRRCPLPSTRRPCRRFGPIRCPDAPTPRRGALIPMSAPLLVLRSPAPSLSSNLLRVAVGQTLLIIEL